MALVLSGSIDISGSMTATTIIVSSPGVAGMVSSSAQITELAPLMAYTASLKGAAIVSSSQQITNYYKFAETASANTFYDTSSFLGITGMGTSTPLSLLHIASGDIDQGIRLTRANGTYGVRITRTGQIQGKLVDDITFQTAISLSEGNTSANQFITLQPTAGNVGVGPLNIAPDNKLHISGSDGIKIQAGGNADTPGLTIINYTNQYGWAKFGGGLQGNGNGYATISCWNGASVSEKVRVSGDGYLRLAGTGIQFNGDTADANSLDDYEEGTWTPTLTCDTSPSGVAYSGRAGKYTKIGRVVRVEFVIGLTSKGTGTGDSFISGLPFTVANDMSAGEPACANISLCTGLSTSVYVLAGWADNGSTNIQLRKTTAASTTYPQSYLNTTDISDSLYIQGSVTYHV
jgi:hypothetical protein